MAACSVPKIYGTHEIRGLNCESDEVRLSLRRAVGVAHRASFVFFRGSRRVDTKAGLVRTCYLTVGEFVFRHEMPRDSSLGVIIFSTAVLLIFSLEATRPIHIHLQEGAHVSAKARHLDHHARRSKTNGMEASFPRPTRPRRKSSAPT